MILRDLLIMTARQLDKTPDQVVDDETEVTCEILSKDISALLDWIYPELEINRLKHVVTCDVCIHSVRVRHKTKRQYRRLCRYDKLEKSDSFFCARGERIE